MSGHLVENRLKREQEELLLPKLPSRLEVPPPSGPQDIHSMKTPLSPL